MNNLVIDVDEDADTAALLVDKEKEATRGPFDAIAKSDMAAIVVDETFIEY
jgi:hypothetical protein